MNGPGARQIPALIVSGFLGSGKTTLVRHLLQHAQQNGVRVALVSNEFGELGIDEALLGDGQEAYVELEGGCVCCQLSNELRDTLQMLWERVQPDQVIVETSGIALPFDTQLTFWRDPVSRWISESIALVVVNAEQVREGRDLEGVFEDQTSSADILVLNKIDLVPATALAGIESRLRQVEPQAPIIPAVYGRVDPAALFPPDPDDLRQHRAVTGRLSPDHGHHGFQVGEIRIDEGEENEALVERLRALRAVRIKGFVQTQAGLRLVQGVGPRIEILPVSLRPRAELIGRLVVITRAAGKRSGAPST